MLNYSQRSGTWSKDGVILVSGCYAGRNSIETAPSSANSSAIYGKNNPDMQQFHNIGPLPRGVYTISPAHDIPHLGHLVMALTPDPSNQMFGRNSFYVHGDNPAHPGQSSDGCIIANLDGRRAIENWRYRGENQVTVVE